MRVPEKQKDGFRYYNVRGRDGMAGYREDPKRCCTEVTVPGSRGYSYQQCKRLRFKDEFCAQHHPESVERKIAAQHLVFDRQRAAQNRLLDFEAAGLKVLRVVDRLSDQCPAEVLEALERWRALKPPGWQ